MAVKYYVYSDIDQDLNQLILTDLDSIKQSILNILTTRKGSRLFDSQFGSNIEDYLFQNMDSSIALMMYNEVIAAISVYEPRVQLDTGKTNVYCDYDNHVYVVVLVFNVPSLSNNQFEYQVGFAK